MNKIVEIPEKKVKVSLFGAHLNYVIFVQGLEDLEVIERKWSDEHEIAIEEFNALVAQYEVN